MRKPKIQEVNELAQLVSVRIGNWKEFLDSRCDFLGSKGLNQGVIIPIITIWMETTNDFAADSLQ